jgi:hypothetical protein
MRQYVFSSRLSRYTVWYQRRFMLPGQSRYDRLDLKPEVMTRGGHKYTRHDLHHWSPEKIFAEDDLYTTQWGTISNTEVERFFFGKLDNDAPKALDYFANFKHPSGDSKAFQTFLRYMSVQKLRTPKGLAFVASIGRNEHKNVNLIMLQSIHDIFCATWTECVWQIADASHSKTKFIVSDNPVTVYNRACPPLSKCCVVATVTAATPNNRTTRPRWRSSSCLAPRFNGRMSIGRPVFQFTRSETSQAQAAQGNPPARPPASRAAA